jgi:uncharacterized protein (DUF1330 family)
MAVYVVGQLKFTDLAAYKRYTARFRGVLKQFGGTLLAADEQPEIIEGRRDKIVLLSFSDATAFRCSSSQPNIRRLQRTERQGRTPLCCWYTALTVEATDSASRGLERRITSRRVLISAWAARHAGSADPTLREAFRSWIGACAKCVPKKRPWSPNIFVPQHQRTP